jgi:hypothetical protein
MRQDIAQLAVPRSWRSAGSLPRRARSHGQGSRPSGQSNTAIKIATTTTKVSVSAVVVGRIGWRIKVKARLLTGLLLAELTAT